MASRILKYTDTSISTYTGVQGVVETGIDQRSWGDGASITCKVMDALTIGKYVNGVLAIQSEYIPPIPEFFGFLAMAEIQEPLEPIETWLLAMEEIV